MLSLHNTLSGKKEEFKPINPHEIRVYNCGPTVYNYAHIGNLRAYVFADILRRTLEANGYSVKQVINATDIGHLAGDGDEGEDKMTKALKREGKPMTIEAMKELADFYLDTFKADLKSMNIESPAFLPKASEHINEDIELIKKIEDRGLVYKTGDGIYFDTQKYPEYGKLGLAKADETMSRIQANPEKKNPRDFSLWKFNSTIGFDSPWGKGFPGWHIECSAMSMKYLGETFDIHTGGIDHISVHHNNEIAQSESATGKPLANYWMHCAFLNIEGGEKMAKSGENFLKLKSITEKNIHPLAYRYFLLNSHYRSNINFNWQALEGFQISLEKIVHELASLPDGGVHNNELAKEALDIANNDLNTPELLGFLHEKVLPAKISAKEIKATVLEIDKITGLDLGSLSAKAAIVTDEVRNFISERDEARRNKDWQKSDILRDEIQNRGYNVKDTPDGTLALRKLFSLI